jgi:hypothetical protein
MQRVHPEEPTSRPGMSRLESLQIELDAAMQRSRVLEDRLRAGVASSPPQQLYQQPYPQYSAPLPPIQQLPSEPVPGPSLQRANSSYVPPSAFRKKSLAADVWKRAGNVVSTATYLASSVTGPPADAPPLPHEEDDPAATPTPWTSVLFTWSLMLFSTAVYLVAGAAAYKALEPGWSINQAVYFCMVTMSTGPHAPAVLFACWSTGHDAPALAAGPCRSSPFRPPVCRSWLWRYFPVLRRQQGVHRVHDLLRHYRDLFPDRYAHRCELHPLVRSLPARLSFAHTLFCASIFAFGACGR